jgi:hypothetical protein
MREFIVVTELSSLPSRLLMEVFINSVYAAVISSFVVLRDALRFVISVAFAAIAEA